MSLRKRRSSGGNRLTVVVAAIVIIAILVVGIGYYGGSIGLPHPLSGGSSGGSADFTLVNANLTTSVSPDDDFAGLSAAVLINNHYSQKMTAINVTIDSYPMGQCSTLSGNLQIAAGSTGTCKIGQNVPCEQFPTPPYVVDVSAKFADGKTASNSLTISQALTTTC